MTRLERTSEFRKIPAQEALLAEVNELLTHAEDAATIPAHPRLPVVFIVGAPRSGTTLAFQWLAASGAFVYPSNLIARFFRAPYTGLRIQQLLTDPANDMHDELFDAVPTSRAYQSNTGKTHGVLQPHEFSYFFRRFFPMDQARRLTDAQWDASDIDGFLRGLAAFEAVAGQPSAFKGILLQYNIEQLAELIPTAVFLHTRRDLTANSLSLLEARERVLGNRSHWFSVQPPEYEQLRDLDPLAQVVGQIECTNHHIGQALGSLPSSRWLQVDYAAFCTDPSDLWAALADRLAALDVTIGPYEGPASFRPSRRDRLDVLDHEAVARARRQVAHYVASS